MLAVLATDVVSHADPAALPPGAPVVVTGARAVGQSTVLFAARSRLAELALVNGAVGLIVAVEDDKITEYTVIADRKRLSQLSLAVLD